MSDSIKRIEEYLRQRDMLNERNDDIMGILADPNADTAWLKASDLKALLQEHADMKWAIKSVNDALETGEGIDLLYYYEFFDDDAKVEAIIRPIIGDPAHVRKEKAKMALLDNPLPMGTETCPADGAALQFDIVGIVDQTNRTVRYLANSKGEKFHHFDARCPKCNTYYKIITEKK